MTWQALPDGEAIVFQPGWYYAIVASVKTNHSAADIHAIAQGRGLVLGDYREEGPNEPGFGPDPRGPDYRYVAVIAQAQGPGKLPWGVPWPASMFDDSQVVLASESPPGVAPAAPVAPVKPPGPAAVPKLWPVVAVLGAGAAWNVWRDRRRRREERRA